MRVLNAQFPDVQYAANHGATFNDCDTVIARQLEILPEQPITTNELTLFLNMHYIKKLH